MKKVKLHKQKSITYVWNCPNCKEDNYEEDQYIETCPDEELTSNCPCCGEEVILTKGK